MYFSKNENFSDIIKLPVLYIHLYHRTDRKELIEEELKNMGLTFERFPAIKESYGALGCSKSHLEVLKLAKKRGYNQVLILEDDFTFIVDKNTFMYTMYDVLSKHFDVCMISYNIYDESDTPNLIWKKVINAQTASGYIIKQHYYDTLIKVFEESIELLSNTKDYHSYAIDQYWKKLQPDGNWYFTRTRMGIQRASFSDIEGLHVSYGL